MINSGDNSSDNICSDNSSDNEIDDVAGEDAIINDDSDEEEERNVLYVLKEWKKLSV